MNVVERKFRAGKNSATLSVIMLIDRNILQVFSPAYLKAMIRRPHLCWHFPSETLIQFLSPGRNLSSLQSPKEIFLALCVYFPFFAYRIAFVWKQEMEIRQLIRKGKRNKIWNYCPLLYVHTNLCWFMDFMKRWRSKLLLIYVSLWFHWDRLWVSILEGFSQKSFEDNFLFFAFWLSESVKKAVNIIFNYNLNCVKCF